MTATKTVTWNGVDSTTIPGFIVGQVYRTLLGESSGVYKKIPGKVGAWFYPQSPGLRRISMECFIESPTIAGRGDIVEDVSDWLDFNGEGKLIISDRSDVFYWATLGSFDTPPEEWRHTAEFTLNWVVQPYSNALTTTTESWTSGTNTNHTWSPGLQVYTYPVITITPTNGTITSFDLEVNGFTLSFQGQISSGATVTINSIVPIVIAGANTDTDLTGAIDPTNAYLAGVTGEYPVLTSAGINNVHYTQLGGTATTIDIEVIYRETYRR